MRQHGEHEYETVAATALYGAEYVIEPDVSAPCYFLPGWLP